LDDNFSELVIAVFAPLRAAGVSPETQEVYKQKYIAQYANKDGAGIIATSKELKTRFDYLKEEHLAQIYIYATSAWETTPLSEIQLSPSMRTDAVVLALKPKVMNGSTFQIHKIEGAFPFNDVKRMIRDTTVLDLSDEAKCKLPFFISKELTLGGNITSSLDKKDKSYSLYEVGINEKTNEVKFLFIGEPRKKGHPMGDIMTFSMPLYTYKFLAEDGREYVLFSVKELTLGRHKVTGMRIVISDLSPFGDSAKFSTMRQVLFVHTAEPDIHQLKPEEAQAIASKHDYETFMYSLRGGYKHPVWFEKFMAAWLLSGKDSGYPLHIAWLSEAGGGKSKYMTALYEQFRELQRPAAIGTLKGLVPHFGGSVPDEGYLCKCQRFGFVDEFFSILRRSTFNKQDTDSGTSLMLPILEHMTYQGDSGSHASITVKPSMRALFCSNMKNYYGFENMFEISQHISNAFMSRILWYVQTDAHVAFVNAYKAKVAEAEREAGEPLYPKHSAEFVSLVDYCTSFMLPVKSETVEQIYAEYETRAVPDGLAEVYRARSRHHIACLVDGIAKVNWITQKRDKLEIRDEDIIEASAIFGTIILSWTPQSALGNEWVPVSIKLNYLSYDQRKLYDFIKSKPNVGREDALVFAPNSEANLQFLVDKGLLELKRSEEFGKWLYEAKAG